MNNRQSKKITGVICFGDSILAGVGASDRQNGCSKLIKSALLTPVSLKGRNRDTSSMALQRLEQDVLSQKNYSHVLILFGNNDGWLNKNNLPLVSQEDFEANIKMLIEMIAGNGQVPILLNLQPLDSKKFFASFPNYRDKKNGISLGPLEWQKQYSDKLVKIANQRKIAFINIRSALENHIEDMICADGLHPTDLGHKSIATTVIKYLSDIDPSIVEGEMGE